MEIGVDSFAASRGGQKDVSLNVQSMQEVLERIKVADKFGLSVYGLGEHYREDFLDSASYMILAAASQVTQNIRLTSAVTVLSTADPVRVFQNFATLDLLSNGRAEIVAGRGSFTEAYPLFGYSLHDYDALFAEKLDLLLRIRDNITINWSGKFRAALYNQSIYPRPVQTSLPIWLGVGGTPASFQRAGLMGLPLMVAIIGGESRRFRPLIDLYRKSWNEAGHNRGGYTVGIHSLGYVAESDSIARDEYYPGYEEMFSKIGRERGWPPITRDRFDFQAGPTGAYLVGSPENVAEKILRHSEALGGAVRFTFQMDNAGLTQEQILRSIKLIGEEVIPHVNDHLEQSSENNYV